MKRSLKEILSYTITTSDGSSASINDILFDEEAWVLRYLEADFGNLFKDKRVLIPRVFFKDPEWEEKHFPVSIPKEDIEKLPPLEKHLPVSREYEKKLRKYYNLDYYWIHAQTGNFDVGLFPPRPLHPPAKEVSQDDVESVLRSFKEIEAYRIQASDGTLGHVEDLIVDDADWQIVFLIIDTKNWVPWSKKVVLSINWLEKIDYPEQQVYINLNTETIKDAPDYESLKLNSREMEDSIFDFYSRSIVK
jgi:sporulation protein YlmC with PRC-barrel domain